MHKTAGFIPSAISQKAMEMLYALPQIIQHFLSSTTAEQTWFHQSNHQHWKIFDMLNLILARTFTSELAAVISYTSTTFEPRSWFKSTWSCTLVASLSSPFTRLEISPSLPEMIDALR